jgi:hypothetical protein
MQGSSGDDVEVFNRLQRSRFDPACHVFQIVFRSQ